MSMGRVPERTPRACVSELNGGPVRFRQLHAESKDDHAKNNTLDRAAVNAEYREGVTRTHTTMGET